jgi:1-aminocyclopropane-1-carboxylate deaminase/D-cysteine desulfhydrase-like pyridoxal-dependent ACC family enzyme
MTLDLTRLTNSPVNSFDYYGRSLWVKRDDLLHSHFGGNKARKLAFLLNLPANNSQRIISYGGNQSNLMLALAALCQLKQWHFTYYTRSLSQMAAANPAGNLAASLNYGMVLIEYPGNLNELATTLKPQLTEHDLLIEQGSYQVEAELGIASLAAELRVFARLNNFAQMAIFIASGTGTSAFYLQRNLPEFKVYTTNCIGSSQWLSQQFAQLSELSPSPCLPIILPNNTYRFATPHLELLTTINSIEQLSGIEFDRVYDPVGWQILLANLAAFSEPLVYIHCGGTMGNVTMDKRYAFLQRRS